MTRKTKVRIALVTVLILSWPLAVLGSWAAESAGSNSGSPKLAEEWREKLVPIDGPEAASGVGAQSARLPNGEWVVWLSANSHGIWVRGGGTVVIRDSRGQVRAFFGHVCGSFGPPDNCKSLDEFYARVAQKYQEHHFG